LVVEVEAVAEPVCAGETEDACVVYDVVGHVATPDSDVKDGTVSVACHVVVLGVAVAAAAAAAAAAVVVAVAAVVEQYAHAEKTERQETPSSYVHLLH
jgi:hypothetical protein